MKTSELLEKSVILAGKLSWTIGPWLPFTGMNTIHRWLIRQRGSILDLGGGWGEPMNFINKKRDFFPTVNADFSIHHLEVSKIRETHDAYVLCDAKLHLPFKDKSFDTVLCLEVIEHLEKEASCKLLSELERIARQRVILSTPVKERLDHEREEDKIMRHNSSWAPNELKKFGYKVRGEGFPAINGYLFVRSNNKLLSLIGCLMYPIASPFVYFFPNIAGGMTCMKSLAIN